VPTVPFQALFVLVILAHERRHVVHFNITAHPTAQQVVEAFPWDEALRYLLGENDGIYWEYMDCPEPHPVHTPDQGRVIAIPEVDALHHHYERVAA